MRVALFVPCYVDQFYPHVAIATLQLLQKLGVEVEFPSGQTCCGQPMANGGFEQLTGGCNRNFVKHFADYDYIVSPSGSCVLHIKEHLHLENNQTTVTHIRNSIYELCEFLTDVLNIQALDATLTAKVALHQGCHGQRGLGLGSSSERMLPFFSKPLQLLQLVKGIEIVPLDRGDECCGFGGTFCVSEEAVSVAMGNSKIKDYQKQEASILTGTDMSCLMHQEGLIRRQKLPIRVMHIAEILAGAS